MYWLLWIIALPLLMVSIQIKRGGVFSILYGIYTSRLGRLVHYQAIKSTRGKDAHSQMKTFDVEDMTIAVVPLLSDNFAYLVFNKQTRAGFVVDPADADMVYPVLTKEKVDLKAVLTTHKHWDHAGGNHSMAAKFGDSLQIIGSSVDRVACMNKPVRDGDQFEVAGMNIQVISAPCHTKGHILFVVTSPSGKGPKLLFSGDTLFVGGVGKFFEGSAEQMLANLDRISALPKDTLILPGHEYTQSNLEWAATVDRNNQILKKKASECFELRKNKLPTVPSSLEEELSYNPFMRTRDEAVKAATQKSDPVQVMASLRLLKNNFKAI